MDPRAAGNVSPRRHKFTTNESHMETDVFTDRLVMNCEGEKLNRVFFHNN